ncbi:hypothetical protein PROFUN_04265 [Planoprotostelium fungivorum]|uniref:Uncharacterized protein n=1 Tax=Planoprotostelium fungivorum TaxID=1890364 RepID=A0A2P6NUZ2_9EUKA|nr:hypothetical protein PROFUN_04265 [Planoprotostelium fungivorum]
MATEEDVSKAERLLEALNKKASVLAPRIVPKGHDDRSLEVFCKTPERQKELKELIQDFQSTRTRCVSCNDINREATHFTTFWTLHFEEKTYTLSNFKLLCDECDTLSRLDRVLSILSESPQDLDRIIQLWRHVNPKQDEEEDEDKIEEKVRVRDQFRQVYSIAYTLQMMAGQMKGWKVLDKSGDEINQKTSLTKLFESYKDKKTGKKRKEESVVMEEKKDEKSNGAKGKAKKPRNKSK